MDFTSLTKYSTEGALSVVLIVIAYKIYKLRVATNSTCCDDHFIVRTVSRGDSSHDLELTAPPKSESMGSSTENRNDVVV